MYATTLNGMQLEGYNPNTAIEHWSADCSIRVFQILFRGLKGVFFYAIVTP